MVGSKWGLQAAWPGASNFTPTSQLGTGLSQGKDLIYTCAEFKKANKELPSPVASLKDP